MTSIDAPAARADRAPFLVLDGVRKSYPGVLALAGFGISVRPGEVIGLVGENGAGKSTVMKILGGVIQPDAGSVTLDGIAHAGLTVGGSGRAGIAFVHQELNLFENLDVAANVFIGREPRRFGLVDTEKLRAATRPLLDRLGANFGPEASVASLSLAQRQLVEIAKALSVDARLVILDEPTSSLPLAETEKLLSVIRGLRDDGVAVIFISHRLAEIEAVADRVVVLRDGRLVGELTGPAISHDNMVKLMVGRDLRIAYLPPKAPPGAVVLSAQGLKTATYPEQPIDLDLRAGEILGLAGLVGAGRTEVARALFGIDPLQAGTLTLGGAPLKLGSSRDAVKAGIFLVPEDRKGTGILLDLPIAENITLPDLPAYAQMQLVSATAETARANKSKSELAIKAPNVAARTGSLSGGNQQKVVLAKWLAMAPRVIIFDEPTRGIDIGAKSEIYRLMRALADSGVAVLMISSDMEEVIGVSDRIAVMHQGQIAGTLERKDFSEENVLTLAIGKPVGRAA